MRPDQHEGHDPEQDEPVTCTLISPTGASINLGTFTLRNGRADWATPTTIDPHTLAQAQLALQHGHTFARATFIPTETSKGQEQDKDRGDSKDDTRQDLKGGKDKDNPVDPKDSIQGKDKGEPHDPPKDGGDASQEKAHTHGNAKTDSRRNNRATGVSADHIAEHLTGHPLPQHAHDYSKQDGDQQITSLGSDHHPGHHQHKSAHHGSAKVIHGSLLH
jgi:hypothetical protein